MASKICDSYLAPCLVPAILLVNIYKIHSSHDAGRSTSNQLYTTVAWGTIITSISTIIQIKIKRSISNAGPNRGAKYKRIATLLTAILLTMIPILTIIGFNMIRLSSTKSTNPITGIEKEVIETTNNSLSDTLIQNLATDIPPAIIIFVQSIFSMILMHSLRHKSKRFFSFGEASIVSQLSSAALATYMFVQYSVYNGIKPNVTISTEIVLTIGASLFIVAFLPLYLLNLGHNTIAFGAFIFMSIAFAYSSIQKILIGESDLDPLTWFAAHLFEKHQRISLFSLWVSTLTACISLSASWARLVGRTNSLIRKTFHVAICIVFISGYNQDLEFASFAAGGVLCVIFLLELCRAWELDWIGPYLEQVCSSLRGGWDNRYLTLSHIYLLVGTFVPLWLLPSNSSKLSISSGLISLGIGDTAAAVVGTFMGKNPIMPSSKKTVEGFLGNFIAMFLFKQYWIGNEDFPSELAFVYVAIITSTIEVITNNCDNLILPLVMTLLNILFFGL